MSELYMYILLSAFIIMLASLIGVIFTWKVLGKWLKPKLPYLIAFASGVFMVIVYNLLSEVVHHGFTYVTFAVFIFGGIFLELLTKLLPKDSHHHHHGSCEHTFTKIDARRVLIGDAIHNVHDGLALVPAFLVSPVVGFGTALGILLHELVQEISEFFILTEAGYSTKKALTWNFIVSFTILVGILLASVLASIHGLTVYLIAFSAGGFSYILVRDLLPSIFSYAKREKKFPQYFLMIFAGFLVMLFVSILVPHEADSHDNEYPLPDGFELVFKNSNTETFFS